LEWVKFHGYQAGQGLQFYDSTGKIGIVNKLEDIITSADINSRKLHLRLPTRVWTEALNISPGTSSWSEMVFHTSAQQWGQVVHIPDQTVSFSFGSRPRAFTWVFLLQFNVNRRTFQSETTGLCVRIQQVKPKCLANMSEAVIFAQDAIELEVYCRVRTQTW
jgi:hypothetical protein